MHNQIGYTNQREAQSDSVRVCQMEVQLREWRIGNGSHGMGMKVSAREWGMRALEWKACNWMSVPHLEAIICIWRAAITCC